MKKIEKFEHLTESNGDMFYFKIPFENNDLTLTKNILSKYYPHDDKADKSLKKLHNHYFNYKSGVICIALNLGNATHFKVYLGVEFDSLFVGCGCGMPDKVLCKHANKVLLNIIEGNRGDFKPYFWPSFDQDENSINKFLDVKVSWLDVKIKPKADYGNLYVAGRGFKNENAILFNKDRSTIAIRRQDLQPVVGYHFLFSAHSTKWLLQLPILLPFWGTANQLSSEILTYNGYITPNNQSTINYPYTRDQLKLNDICFKMYELAVGVNRVPSNFEYSAEWKHAISELLKLWREAIPILKKEPYSKTSYSFGLKRLLNKPQKKDVKEFSMDLSTLDISFLLKEHEDHYSFEPIIHAWGRNITEDYWKIPLFIVDWTDPNHYHFHLVDDLQDDTLLQWICSTRKRLTIMKNEFDQFYEKFLSKIDDFYVIYFIGFQRRKKVRWNKKIPVAPGYHQGLADDRKRQING